MTATIQTVWACVGELAGMIISLDTFLGRQSTWHFALALPTMLIPFAIGCLLKAHDSPRSLLIAGKKDEALRALEYYQCPEDWQASLNDISAECHAELSPNPTSLDDGVRKTLANMSRRMKMGSFLRPLLIATFVLTFVHLDDWLWISYSTQVFENVGLSPNSATRASLFMSLPQAMVSILLLFYFDDFSRRSLLIVPTIVSVFCALLGVLGLFSRAGHLFGAWPMYQVMPILATIDLASAAAASESAYTVVPELFSQRDRILGSAIVGIAQNCFGGVVATISLSVVNIHGTQFVLIPFVLMNIVYVIVVYRYLPETNGKSFQAISAQFQDDIPPILRNLFAPPSLRAPLQWLSAHFLPGGAQGRGPSRVA
ncbi:Protein SLCF-2, partial [Aphelenchoides avenae]